MATARAFRVMIPVRRYVRSNVRTSVILMISSLFDQNYMTQCHFIVATGTSVSNGHIPSFILHCVAVVVVTVVYEENAKGLAH